jgi:hypothetical protein
MVVVTTGNGGTRWAVRLSVARRGGPVAWGAASGEFERDLATQASDTVHGRFVRKIATRIAH